MVVLRNLIIFLDETLKEIQDKFLIPKDIDSHIYYITCCTSDLETSNQSGYLFAFFVRPSQKQYHSLYEGKNCPDFTSWLMRCSLNQQNLSIGCDNKKENSLLIDQEYVASILEYAQNQIIVHVKPTDLLIVNCWKVTQLIKDPDSGNICKLVLTPLPGFDKDFFPFVVCTGNNSMNLINVKEHHMQVMVKGCVSLNHG